MFEARKIWLMKELWKLSEAAQEAGNSSDALLLEAAGNVVENSFCIGEPADLALSAISDAMERA